MKTLQAPLKKMRIQSLKKNLKTKKFNNKIIINNSAAMFFAIFYMIEQRPEVSDPIRDLGIFLKSIFCISGLKTGGGNRSDESSSSTDECLKQYSSPPEFVSA